MGIFRDLRSALNSAAKRRLIPYNPAIYVDVPPEAQIRPVPWDQDEVRRFIAQARGDRLFALYLLILVTGMRRGETLGLRWQDVDLDAGGLRVVQQLVELRGQLIVGKPKTRSGSRTVPLDPTTVELLRAQRAVQETEREQWGDA